ncbi:ileal sodium/bile acid cotransporter isoform X1 [Patella vulgata]|uniref:ileal sodium/bile acid cotransporter isoform X1 n=1 Tax=Patella vulgata TaxID=6465 RepID=UPI0021800803|nr:ileal sodium/bile acid cotransporter isoform X1 [Patella vulgata]
MLISGFFILVVWLLPTSRSENFTNVVDIDLKQDVPIVINDDGKESILNFNYSVFGNTYVEALFVVDNSKKAEIIGETLLVLNESSIGEVSFKVTGKIIGRTYLNVLVREHESNNGANETLLEKFELIVTRVSRPIDTAFNVVIITLVVVATMAMGCKIDPEVVKATLKRPVAPVIGLLSQFLFMPTVSFLAAYYLELDPAIAIGYFALGCSPGGSASNVYTYLLGGDISLSVTMTLVSTVCSLGLIPMWLFTVGQKVIYKGTTMQIPYVNIITSLLGLIIPVFLGMVIQYKRPNWAKKLVKIIKPLVFIFLLFAMTVGVYANLYIFDFFDPIILLVGAIIPYSGFLFGLLISFVTRQPKKNLIAIVIETGIQNTGIPIVLLRISLSPPESDISIIGPIASSLFMPIPFIIILVAIEIRKRCCKKKLPDEKNDLAMMDEPATFTKLAEDGSPAHSFENLNSHTHPINNTDR